MKNALITGASKGIGRAIASAFAKQGLNLAICSRNIKDLTETQTEINALYPDVKIAIRQTDTSDKTDLLAFAAFARAELGETNVLVNNVGAYAPAPLLTEDDANFDAMVKGNLMPAYQLYRYFGNDAPGNGLQHIFNISSVAARFPSVNAGSYSVTKAALQSLNNVMRLEMIQHGVKVTAVIPGSTLTASWDGEPADKTKFVLPQDVANAIITIYNMSAGANVDEIVITPLYGQQ